MTAMHFMLPFLIADDFFMSDQGLAAVPVVVVVVVAAGMFSFTDVVERMYTFVFLLVGFIAMWFSLLAKVSKEFWGLHWIVFIKE